MTCIVAIVDGGKVHMGADSAASSGWDMRVSGVSKLFTKGPYIFGFTYSFRMGQILHHMVDYPESETYDETFMVREFTEVVRDRLKALGFSKINSNQEEGGKFVVGVRGHLYEIDSDFQVQHYPEGFTAVGCGAPYALGSIHSTKGLPVLLRIDKALEAAEHFSNGVRGPFITLAETGAVK